jgi:hypothetical protein
MIGDKIKYKFVLIYERDAEEEVGGWNLNTHVACYWAPELGLCTVHLVAGWFIDNTTKQARFFDSYQEALDWCIPYSKELLKQYLETKQEEHD